jgi:hypothetical protein
LKFVTKFSSNPTTQLTKIILRSYNLIIFQLTNRSNTQSLSNSPFPPHKSIIIHVYLIISLQYTQQTQKKLREYILLDVNFHSTSMNIFYFWKINEILNFSLFAFIIGKLYFMWIIYLPIYMYMFVVSFVWREKNYSFSGILCIHAVRNKDEAIYLLINCRNEKLCIIFWFFVKFLIIFSLLTFG